MINLNDINKVLDFYERLGDEESKKIFMARWKFFNDHNKINFMRAILELYSEWHIDDFSSYFERMNVSGEKKLVIYGYGEAGKTNKILLEKCGYKIDYIVDRNYRELSILDSDANVPICSPERLFYDIDKPIVLISMADLAEERNILRTLRSLYGFPNENIYLPEIGGTILGHRGNQYFDLPYLKREDEEIFVDGGCYDGSTTKYFHDWAGKNFKKSIAFECDKRSIPVVRNNMKDLERDGKFFLIEKGLYSQKSELHFVESTLPTSSYINNSGHVKVSVDSLDNVLEGEKITFIKLDVQGAELEALKGARETICQYHPKLAISLYHKDTDLYEIPLWFMEATQGYKFYIRHYNTDECETVLYAI